MMAGVVRVRSTPSKSVPSSSSRHTLRVHDALDGLEAVGSGPRLQPVEPASMLDPKGGDGEVLGMGVHAKSTTWCLLDASGEVAQEGSTSRLHKAASVIGHRELGSAPPGRPQRYAADKTPVNGNLSRRRSQPVDSRRLVGCQARSSAGSRRRRADAPRPGTPGRDEHVQRRARTRGR